MDLQERKNVHRNIVMTNLHDINVLNEETNLGSASQGKVVSHFTCDNKSRIFEILAVKIITKC